MKKAGAIIRVSTTRQLEGTSPEKQREAIIRFAEHQGFELTEENIWEIAESGSSRDREGFRLSLQASAEKKISRIYVFSIDRLGRDLLEMLLFLRQLDDLDIECWSVEKGELLRDNDFMFQILGAVASKERQEIVKRTQDGLKRAIIAGKYSGGIIPFGYKLNPETKKLEIQEEEAEIIRLIYKWTTVEGISTIQIAERLNALSIPTRYSKDGRLLRQKGKREGTKTQGIWRAGRVLNLIKNTCYSGDWYWGKRSQKKKKPELIHVNVPQIIDKKTFELAQQRLKSNQLFNPDLPHRDYLLRGLIICGVCGKAFCGSASKVGPDRSQEKTYYRCNGVTQWRKLGMEKCEAMSVNAQEIEDIVWEDIKAFCKDPNIAISQLMAQRKPLDDSLPTQIEQITKQITEYERQEMNLLRVASQSDAADPQKINTILTENNRSKKILQDQLEQLHLEKGRSSNIEIELLDISDRLSKLNTKIDNASFDEKRRAVVELVKEIKVMPEVICGKRIPVVYITYRFNEPCPEIIPQTPTLIQNYTPARADTMVIPANHAPAPMAPSPNTSGESPVRLWTVSTFTLRFRASITKSSVTRVRENPPVQSMRGLKLRVKCSGSALLALRSPATPICTPPKSVYIVCWMKAAACSCALP